MGQTRGVFVAQRRWEKQSTQARNSLTSMFQAGAGPEPTFPSKGAFTRLPWPSGLKLLNPTFESSTLSLVQGTQLQGAPSLMGRPVPVWGKPST